MNATAILAQAKSAADDHFRYAQFVKDTEMSQDDTSLFVDDGQRSAYQECWFELEIVNALALDEWECDGRPNVWTDAWNARFKNDAKELIEKLCHLIQGSV